MNNYYYSRQAYQYVTERSSYGRPASRNGRNRCATAGIRDWAEYRL